MRAESFDMSCSGVPQPGTLNPEPLNLCYNKDGFGVLDLEDQVISGFKPKEYWSVGVLEKWKKYFRAYIKSSK